MKTLIALTLLLLSALVAAAEGDTCVLVFERDNQPLTKAITGFFTPVIHTTVKTEAVPVDLLNCLRSGASEVVFVAHGFWRKETGRENPVFQLGYFVRAKDDKGRDVYQPKLFYNKIFDEAYKILAEEQARTGTVRLKRFRFAACGIESLEVTHPALTRLIQDFVREYDEAPESKSIITRLLAGNVPGIKRSINYRWLSQSGRCSEAIAWQTSRSQRKECTSDSQRSCDRSKAKFCRAIR